MVQEVDYAPVGEIHIIDISLQRESTCSSGRVSQVRVEFHDMRRLGGGVEALIIPCFLILIW